MSYVSDKLRQKIVEQAGDRCGYCLGEQRYIFAPLEINHLLPTGKGGTDDEENLWLACRFCNSHKGMQTQGFDEITKKKLPLFNPRKQNWNRHFIIENSIEIVGKTSVGRATVYALQMNNHLAITVRKNWLIAGWYPPKD
jgi:HNH endonuclease